MVYINTVIKTLWQFLSKLPFIRYLRKKHMGDQIDVSKEFYLEAANDVEIATKFWNTYNVKPFILLENRQFLQLRDKLIGLLWACKNCDAQAFDRIHKGHPYYFIGITSFLLDDYQTAIYFFDAAVTEDLNAGAHPTNNKKPSTNFLMLEGAEERQGGRIITSITENKIDRVLNHYQNEIIKDPSIRQMTKDVLRNDFIVPCLTNNTNPGMRTLVTAMITFCIEWDFRNEHFDLGVKSGTSEPFFSHLLRGCLLFESLLKQRSNVSGSLNTMLNNRVVREKLKIKPIDGGAFTLDSVFAEILKYNMDIHETISITYKTRNTLGHDMGWDNNISQEQYRQLFLIIATSCFHVINCLWE